MQVSVRKKKIPPGQQRRHTSRYQQLVDAVEHIGLEALHTIELHSRAGTTAGKFAFIEVALDFFMQKEGQGMLDLQSAEDVADRLFELALEYEDEHGPQTFQALIFPRDDDGSRAKEPVKRSFRTSDDPSASDERGEANLEVIQAHSRAMREFQKTQTALLKDLRDTAEYLRGKQPSPETAGVVATAGVELKKVELEHAHDERMMDIIDKRLDQLISEIAPGVRQAIETEPSRNTLPERLRECLAALDDTQREQLRDVLGGADGPMWVALSKAATCETNVDFRSEMEDFTAEFGTLARPAKVHLEQEIARVIPAAILKRFIKTLQSGGVV